MSACLLLHVGINRRAGAAGRWLQQQRVSVAGAHVIVALLRCMMHIAPTFFCGAMGCLITVTAEQGRAALLSRAPVDLLDTRYLKGGIPARSMNNYVQHAQNRCT
jgi:hypothetical protein